MWLLRSGDESLAPLDLPFAAGLSSSLPVFFPLCCFLPLSCFGPGELILARRGHVFLLDCFFFFFVQTQVFN